MHMNMRHGAKVVGYVFSILYVLWMIKLINLMFLKHDGGFDFITHTHMGITLLLIISLLLPYDKMRFFAPLCISLSGFFFLIMGVLIECFDEMIRGMMGVNFICAGVIFFIFFLGTDNHHKPHNNFSRSGSDTSN